MAGLSQPRPCGEIKIIPIFGTVSIVRIFQILNTYSRLPLGLGRLSCRSLAYAGLQ